MNKQIVVRMAPSPTGNLHLGTARTTLFNYLFAKKSGGKFIMRIEDTDKERSKPEFEKNILDGLEWLRLPYDEFYRQSERTEIYVSYLKKMIDSGHAYVSKEEPKEEGQRSEVIRFKNPNKKIVFHDLIRGDVEFDTSDLGDFVIAKSLEEPLYHLAVVVDDHEMNVTHVIRGEDHISNTPRQILIQEAIGAVLPEYAHLPLIVDEERKKLSKRKHGELVWVDTYRARGYLAQAFLNYLALLGWNPGTEQEIFSLDELSSQFSLDRVQKGGALFSDIKLRWVNKEHIKRLPRQEIEAVISAKIGERFLDADIPGGLIDVVVERIEIFSDIDGLIEKGELNYFFRDPEIDRSKISWKDTDARETIVHLEKVIGILEEGKTTFEEDLMAYATEAGKGNVLWPVRYALTGLEKSPDPFTLIKILGKDTSLSRVRKAIEVLK